MQFSGEAKNGVTGVSPIVLRGHGRQLQMGRDLMVTYFRQRDANAAISLASPQPRSPRSILRVITVEAAGILLSTIYTRRCYC